jgi:hypothetical protein
MPDSGHIRVSDEERERQAEELQEHMVAGRLTSEEYEQRLGAVYAARTRSDLDELRRDLPVSSAAAKRALVQRKSKLRRRLLQEAGGSITASLVCVAIWLAAGAQGDFWPAWVILFTLMPVARDAWRLLGPGSDLDAFEARLQARHEKALARERLRRHHRGRLLP